MARNWYVAEVGEVVWGRRLARRWRPKTGAEAMIGMQAEVVSALHPVGQVHVNGEKVDQNVARANAEFKTTGEQIKAGANQAGAAIQRGADKVQTQVETKVVPAAKELLNDANITATVKTKLAGDPAINAIYVNVDTSHGQVTLSGKVALAEQKVEAEKVARKVEGVTSVVNQLVVTGTPG